MSNLATITNNILADSGIDDINVIVSTGSYANPAWITSLAWTKITGAPLGDYLPLVGGTMTGNINWAQTDRGITWSFNTDGASIKFYNTGDGDTNSRLEFATVDNNNEYFRWVHIPDGGTLYESMRLVPNSSGNAQLLVSGSAGIGTNSITNGTTFGGGGQINRLKVQSSNYTALEINGSTSGGSIQFTYGTNLPNQVSGLIGYNYSNGTVNEFSITNVLSGPMIFATTSEEAMRITSGGYLWLKGGISGMTASQVDLQVPNGARIANQLILHNGANTALSVALSCIGASSFQVDGSATFNGNVTSSGGWIQFANNWGIEGRNAANTAYRTVFKLNTSNQIEIGRDTDISSIILGTASAVNALTLASTGAATFSSSVTAAQFIVGSATTSSDVSVRYKTDTGDFSTINERNTHSFGIYDNQVSLYRLYINSSGNVGIGTPSPSTILDVNGTINVRTNGFEFGRITTNNITGNLGGLTFQYNASGTFTNGIVLNHIGNVGIGTPSPARKLDVNGVTRSNAFDVFFNSVSSGFLLSETQWTGVAGANNMSIVAEGGVSGGGNITFFTNGSLTERMRITSDGNVRFTSINASLATYDLNYRFSTPDSARIRFSTTTSFNQNEPGELSFWTRANDAQGGGAITERMRIASNGIITMNSLAGSGNRIVVANSGGTLISAVIGSGLAFDGTTLTATGGGSGSISGSGTSGTVALFTGTTSIGNSVITQSGSTIGITSGITDSVVTFTNSTAYSTSNNYSLTYRSTTASFGIQPIANIIFDTVGDAASRIRFVTRANAADYDTRMTITAGGNVGIGTLNPGGKLGIQVANSGSNVSGLDVTNATNASFNVSLRTDFTTITAGGTGNLVFANASERLRVHSSGTIAFSNNGGVGNAGTDTMSMGHFSSNYGWIQTWAGTPLLLNPSGNPVIIGSTSNNGARFQVSGTATVSSTLTADGVAFIGQVPTYGTDFAQFSHNSRAGSNQYSFLSQNNGGTYVNSHNSQPIYFRHNNSNLATISSTGTATFSSNVIAASYNVTNESVFRGGLYPYKSITGGGTDFGITIFSEGGTGNGNIYFCPNGSATRVMTINTSSRVLIGTDSDNGNRLRVNGTIWSDSSITATSFFESSDATLKTLVEDNYQAKGIDSVVAKLYIKNGKEELGYFAQDLQDVLPSAVSKGSDGLLNLSYREVHTAKIAYLEERIKQLEKKYENN
jgi:hypothetical protein